MTIDRADQVPDDRRCRWDEWQPELYRRWHNFALWCQESPDVDDLVQETVLRAWLHHRDEPFPSLKDAVTWGVTVCHNLVRDQGRFHLRHTDVPWDDVPESAVSSSPTPDAIVETREVRRLVRKALDRLRPEDAGVIRAAHFDGLSYAQGGALFGISATAFGARLCRALDKLEKQLTKLGLQHMPMPLLTAWPARRLRGDRIAAPIAAAIAAGAVAAMTVPGVVAGAGRGPDAFGAHRAPTKARPPASAPGWTLHAVGPDAPVLEIRDLRGNPRAHVRPPSPVAATLNALVCIGVRDHDAAGLCLTSGQAPAAETASVRVPTKRVVDRDVYVYVEQSVVSVCRDVPDSPFTGCAAAEPHPDPTSLAT